MPRPDEKHITSPRWMEISSSLRKRKKKELASHFSHTGLACRDTSESLHEVWGRPSDRYAQLINFLNECSSRHNRPTATRASRFMRAGQGRSD